jgi:hypothetical protein
MDWTKPLHDACPMGIEWLAEPWMKEKNSVAEDDYPGLPRDGDESSGPKAWRVRISAWPDGIRRGGRQGFPAELAEPNP